MPEFQRRKHRSLTDEQLYEEYHRTDEPKKKSKPAAPAKKPAVKREAPPVSPKRTQNREQEPPKKKEQPAKNPPEIIIRDGELNQDALSRTSLGEGWVTQILRQNKTKLPCVFLMSADNDGNYQLVLKEDVKCGG